MSDLPPLVDKALVDAGYDVVKIASDGWICARISGVTAHEVRLRVIPGGTLLELQDAGVVDRIGLLPVDDPPNGSANVGLANSPQGLLQALRSLKTLQTHPAGQLSDEVEARLARIPATERTREVRERIGQEVFRDALIDFWGGRCALSGRMLPSALVRASHAKPWAQASNAERLDPFNGLLLAVRYDALFDKGLIAFNDEGALLMSPALDEEAKGFVGLAESMRLRFVLPGHVSYLRYHREYVARMVAAD
jgi:hypothetical protein